MTGTEVAELGRMDYLVVELPAGRSSLIGAMAGEFFSKGSRGRPT